MNILSNEYVSNVPNHARIAPGGPANFARELSGFVTEHGHTWTGIIHQGTKEGSKTVIRQVATVGKKTYAYCEYPFAHVDAFLQSTKKIDPRVWFAPQIECIREYIRRVQPDLLFLNGFSVYAWILLEAANQEGLPIVIQHAGISQVEFEQYKDLFSHVGRMGMLQMERDVVDAATRQVFLNDYSRRAFCARVARVPKAKAVIIPLPYQKTYTAARTVHRAKTQDPNRIVVGCVARWDRIKNHEAILHLAKEIKSQGLAWNMKCVTKIPVTAKKQRFKKAYANAIDVIPHMAPDELRNFYDSVDLMVLPSHFDVSPTVVMEAALQGKGTLISPTVGWVSEYKEAGMADWVIDFTDPKRVISRIRKLCSKPMPTRFQKHIKATHAPKKVFAAYLRLFASVT